MDSYEVKQLQALNIRLQSDVRPAMTQQLEAWTKARCDDLPNIMLYGPRGSGKQTCAATIIKSLSKAWDIPLTYTERDIPMQTKTKSLVPKKGETVRVKSSFFTFEIDVDDMSLRDKQHLPAILEILCGQPDIRGIPKIMVLHHVHRMGDEAQLRFAYALQEYGAHTRFICTMEPQGQIEELVASRFVRIPVPAFTDHEIAGVITGIAPRHEAIVNLASGNMNRAIFYVTQMLILGTVNDPIRDIIKRLIERMYKRDDDSPPGLEMLAVIRAYATTFMEHHIPVPTIIDEAIQAVMDDGVISEDTKGKVIDLFRTADWSAPYRRFLWLEKLLVDLFQILRQAT